MINLHERMLPTSAGVEPATSWSPVERRIQMSHRGRHFLAEKHNLSRALSTHHDFYGELEKVIQGPVVQN